MQNHCTGVSTTSMLTAFPHPCQLQARQSFVFKNWSIPSATARLQYILLSNVVLFPLHSLFFLFFHKKVAPYSITNIWHKAGPHFLAVSPQVTVISPVVECFSFIELFNSMLHAWYSTNTHKLTGPPLTDGDRCY